MVPRYTLPPSAVQQDQAKGEYVRVSDYTAALNTALAAIREFEDVACGKIPPSDAMIKILCAAKLLSPAVGAELDEHLR